MIRVLHVITGLHTGGAEVNLSKLVCRMDRGRFENRVISILKPGAMAGGIRDAGVFVDSLNVTRSSPDPRALFALRRHIDSWKPDVIQTWMYHADLLGTIAGKLFGSAPVIWNIRQSEGVLKMPGSSMTRIVAKVCAVLSRNGPYRIVCCSYSSALAHERFGYVSDKIVVICNGYDYEHFRPDPGAAVKLRAELHLDNKTSLIGHIGRFHPHKDHKNFLEAASLVRKSHQDSHFVMCGHEITWNNRYLVSEIERLGLRDCIHLLGPRTDVNRIMAASTVMVSSSSSEGFPNVVAEAMACGALCVVTDVGESRRIVGETGIIVPPGSPALLADGIIEIIKQGGCSDAKKLQARQRVISQFALDLMVQQYEQLYEQAVAFGVHANKGAGTLCS